MSKNVVELNGVYVNPQGSHIKLFAQPLADTSGMRELRDQLEPEWFLTWRNGTAYGLPRVASPKVAFGKRVTLKCADEPQLVAAVTLDALLRKVEAKGHRVLRRRPFLYVGEQKDLMAVALGNLADPPRILSKFRIVGKYQFNAKLLEPRDGRSAIGLVMGLGTHWEINAPLTELAQAGVDLRGLAVVRRVRKPRERGLVGRVASLEGSRVLLADAYDGATEVPVAEVWVERSKAVFTHCLRSILGTEYDNFEAQRRLAEAGFLSSVAFDRWVESMATALQKRLSPLDVGGGLSVKFGARIEIANTPDYESVSEASKFAYFFNQARTHRSTYAWSGIEEYGPFGPPAKHSPRIAVICPGSLQGSAKSFIDLLRLGVTDVDRSHFSQGFKRAFGLVNPEFPFFTFRWGGSRDGAIAEPYVPMSRETAKARRSV